MKKNINYQSKNKKRNMKLTSNPLFHNRKCFLGLLLLFLLIISACGRVTIQPRKFYVLEYKTVTENRVLFATVPNDFTVRVLDSEISGTYNRRQIVIRVSENQIMYDFEHLWADRLPNALANLIHQRISRYGIFNRVIRDFNQPARYEIVTIVNSIEYLHVGNMYGANLNIEFQFRRTSDNLTVFQHTAERTRHIQDDDMDMFVQSINDLLMEETDVFLVALNRYIRRIEDRDPFLERGFFTSRSLFDDSEISNYRTEYLEDEDLTFMGRLFIPSRTEPELEPLFSVEDEEGNYFGSYQMGTDVYLQPGNYFILLGTGTLNQKIIEEVEIFTRYKTVLEPDAGWLTINIIDNNRNQVDVRYELFHLSNAESFGFGSGIREGVGQQLDTWILNPGHYKIVLNGLPFNTYSDFATVEVKRGELEQFTIVVDENSNNLIGAGRMLHEDFFTGSDRFRFSIVNHLNANINSRNDVEKNEMRHSYTVTEQLDTRLIYDVDPFHYTMSNLIEIGISKDPDTDVRISSDKFDFKNTLVYFFYRNLGLYARADLNSHMFDEYVHTSENEHYRRVYKDGSFIDEETNRFHTKDPFYPIVLKQGLGLNVRLLNKSRANLNFRAGLGFRQDLNDGVFNFDRTDEDGINIYRELDSVYQRGTEFSANGNFQIFRNLNYITSADLLIPFESFDARTYEWENILNLRMFQYISWDYRVNFSYNHNIRDYVFFDQTLFLRFTYIFIN